MTEILQSSTSPLHSPLHPDGTLAKPGGAREDGDQLSILEFFFTALRKAWIGCKVEVEHLQKMEIGVPTNVRHVAHVTFDRFNGFLGLPVEFELQIPRIPPSASAKVFGVSTESMQLSFDSRGNSVPTILLLMQQCLYTQGGLEAEGIFRINAENGHEELVRDQLNSGVVPAGVDVHCLAGLIKAWFRELPTGVLDSLPPEQVMQPQTEEECAQVAKLLPPTEAALLDWSVNLMADVAQMEHANKMNARNVAMVFAPNMTHMTDPLTALMYAVQVMNFLKNLIERSLKEREAYATAVESEPSLDPFDDDSEHPVAFGHGGEEETDGQIPFVHVADDPTVWDDREDPEREEEGCENEERLRCYPNWQVVEERMDMEVRKKRGQGWDGGRQQSLTSSKGRSVVSQINSFRMERVEAWI